MRRNPFLGVGSPGCKSSCCCRINRWSDRFHFSLVYTVEFVSVEIAEHSKLSRMDYGSCKLGLDWEKPMASEGLESPIWASNLVNLLFHRHMLILLAASPEFYCFAYLITPGILEKRCVYPAVNKHNYRKSQFLTGNSTISMAIFNNYVKLPEGIVHITSVSADASPCSAGGACKTTKALGGGCVCFLASKKI